MRTIALILVLFLVACKKEDPKPEPAPPAPITKKVKLQAICDKEFTAIFNLDSDAEPETTIVSNGGINFFNALAEKTISVTARKKYPTIDTIRIIAHVDNVLVVDVKDTAFTNRVFTLW